jgi:hypothetical protein
MEALNKYKHMFKSGIDRERVYMIAKNDGLGGRELYTLLHDILGYSYSESGTMVKVDGYSLARTIQRSATAPTARRDQFREIFDTTLEAVARLVESSKGSPIPRNFKVEIRGLGGVNNPLSPDQAFDVLYLGDEQYYLIIDVTVSGVSDEYIVVRMQVTGHGPGIFAKTWNRPEGAGPFKLINLDTKQKQMIVEQTFAEIRGDIDL